MCFTMICNMFMFYKSGILFGAITVPLQRHFAKIANKVAKSKKLSISKMNRILR